MIEYWIRDGHHYAATQAPAAGPLHAIAVGMMHLPGADRSVRIPMTKENAEGFRDALVERMRPFGK